MHVTAVIDVIKKPGHFEDYKKAAYTYEKARKAVESAKAGLALLEEGGEITKKASKKKTNKGEKEAAVKVPDPKAPDPNSLAKATEQGQTQKKANVASATRDDKKASFLSDLEEAKLAQRTAKGEMD
jgi:hypothetical protein